MIQLYAIAGLGLAVATAGGWAMLERSGRHNEALQRVEADRVSTANVRAVEEMRAAHAVSVAALEAAAAATASATERSNVIRSQVHAAAVTSECIDSPAMRALLDGLRGDQDRTPDRAP